MFPLETLTSSLQTNLLTQSSYLRLDPNVMHYNIYAAGRLLAEFGREEVAMCIRGLQQYGVSYDDALDQAAEIQSIYASRRVEPEPAPQAWEGISDADTHHNVSRHCPMFSCIQTQPNHLVVFSI
jgi:hypothetical protein